MKKVLKNFPVICFIIVICYSCQSQNGRAAPTISIDTITKHDTIQKATIVINKYDNISKDSALYQWYGIYVYSPIDSSNNYDSIISNEGWFRLRVSADSITYDSDYRMISEHPQCCPEGYHIEYTCSAKTSNKDTLIVNLKDSRFSVLAYSGSNPCLILYKKGNKYVGKSEEIKISTKLYNKQIEAENNPIPEDVRFIKFPLSVGMKYPAPASSSK